jgi:hypothetical protein
MTRLIAFVLLLALSSPLPAAGHLVAGTAAADGDPCKAEPPGIHDPTAELNFTATLQDGQAMAGRQFDHGNVRDLRIQVEWKRIRTYVRQRLALYSPDGQLYQMFTTDLGAYPDPVNLMLPVRGTWIMSATLTGTWCAKIFLDDDEAPVAAESFELRRP